MYTQPTRMDRLDNLRYENKMICATYLFVRQLCIWCKCQKTARKNNTGTNQICVRQVILYILLSLSGVKS